MYLNNARFYESLTRHPRDRTQDDLSVIYNNLRKLDIFNCLNDAPLRIVCQTARLERHASNHVLFRKGQVATCWYILLNGSVYMNKQIYMPVGCFGKRNGMNLRRSSDCVLLQNSDIIVIDYPDVQRIPVQHSTPGIIPSNPAPSAISCNNGVSQSSSGGSSVSTFHRRLQSLNLNTDQGNNAYLQRPPVPQRVPSPAPPSHPYATASVTVIGDTSAANRPMTSAHHEPSKWYVSPQVPSSSSATQPPLPARTASVGPQVIQSQLNEGRPFHGSATSSISIGNHSGHNGPVIVTSSGSISGPSPTVQLRAVPTSHKNMPPPPPPTVSNSGTSSPASTSSVPFSARSEHDATNAPLTHRFSKTRFQFSRKSNEDVGTTTVKVRALSGNQASINNVARRLRARSTASSSTTDGDDFSGLPEASVDSEDEDEESCPSHDSYQELKDNVRECLEKEPAERNGDDISILMEFMQQMPALACLPLSIKRQLCLKMVFAVVADAGTVILQHGEKIDSWSVIVNGAVEHVKPNGDRIEYRLGDCFGAEPIPAAQFNEGEMRTLVDDCEFVLVEHSDYCTIMSTVHQHIEKESDGLTGEIVSETERRMVGNQVGLVLIKAKPEKLVQHLIDDIDTTIDAHFVEDFLLMYRVFMSNPMVIMERMLSWFKDATLRDKVARILLLWVNNHFNDFESNKEMTNALEMFEAMLESKSMFSQQALLNITCSVKSRPRQVTLTRSNRDQELAFNILGGKELNQGLFVSYVDPGTVADKNGLKRGDEILEVNGQSFRHITLQRALEILRECTHISLTLKSNLMGFKEMLHQQEKLQHQIANGTDNVDSAVEPKSSLPATNGTVGRFQKKNVFASNGRRSTLNVLPTAEKGGTAAAAGNTTWSVSSNSSSGSSGNNNKSTMFEKLFGMLKGSNHSDNFSDTTDEVRSAHTLRTSRSNPDISGHLVKQSHNASVSPFAATNGQAFAEQAIKIYRGDQSVRYLTIFPETTAKNVVQLALQEFGMNSEGSSTDWSLCECTVTREGVNKQRRLPDDMQNLAERIGLNSRFYLKNNTRSENLIPDELAPEILKESKINLQTLNAQFVASQLTLHDFAVFSSIEPTEYVDNLFQIHSTYGWPQLTEFEDLFNREMWWVVTEVCSEKNLAKRVKLIKKFIKVARHCRDLRNFNSMFAIVSGLEKPAVRRLAHSWERISGKYLKMLADVQQLMDPSRNMSKYRQHLASVAMEPPVVPIYPILRKDLIFSHEANPSYSDKLVNFEKLRMIARIIRSIVRLSSVNYDMDLMLQPGFSGDATAATIRKAVNSNSNSAKQASGQSRKKLYEQTLMIRKVKSYLATLQVIDSELELDRLSVECEPPPPGTNLGGGSAMQQRRRGPSPSPSSVSSHSNQSNEQKTGQRFVPKFGVESPQAVQKMLSLVQTSRVKNQAGAKPHQLPLSGSGTSKKSSISSGTTANSNTSGNTPQLMRRIPSFNSKSGHNEMGVDVGHND
uniref:Rap guanine nucleotide exchange factor 2 n=1 Tax=Panagrellus redivivus TaxID=6233 RepID=A0A7E4ZSZ7_PANRE